MKIGILSDTHDLLRPEVTDALQGCDYILHGGDISSQRVLDQLERIAPVKAVRGNNDKEWAEYLPLFLDQRPYLGPEPDAERIRRDHGGDRRAVQQTI